MTEDHETRVSARRARDGQDAPADDTAVSDRATADSTRMSRRRIAESATQPAAPDPAEISTRPAADAPRRREDDVLRPPPDLAARIDAADGVPPARAGAFGHSPQHYYPRIRHTQDARGAGVWPEPPRTSDEGPEVLDESGREDRRLAASRSRHRRRALAVAGGIGALAAAVAVALALL
ncbi:hypothetical protein QQX09_09330 [Demequina sp. SYSU T00192]|uniref:Uncharacterized protein n=1 Tax=Demequina litoralis TaxID=3051660 RepID=A0ABT8GA84_9MICO|nr:hypothetical protein [Demequina sp. SYSU T00192]MDN4476054.1 hypothetical protein [Demequina sp. SYSU T00192]